MNSEKFQSLPIRVSGCVLLKQHDLRPAAILYGSAHQGGAPQADSRNSATRTPPASPHIKADDIHVRRLLPGPCETRIRGPAARSRSTASP